MAFILPFWQTDYHALIPAPLRPIGHWLKTPILSEALRKIDPNLRLKLITQAINSPHPDEAQKLNLDLAVLPLTLPLIRQVCIGSADYTYLYCRVVIPAPLYQQEQETFDGLGDRFIGETLLYHQPNVHRSLFEYAVLKPEQTLYQEALQHAIAPPSQFYARRSLFYLPILPLLITEVFIHAFMPS